MCDMPDGTTLFEARLCVQRACIKAALVSIMICMGPLDGPYRQAFDCATAARCCLQSLSPASDLLPSCAACCQLCQAGNPLLGTVSSRQSVRTADQS